MYDSKAKAEKAYKGYMAHKHMKLELKGIKEKILEERKELEKIKER